MAIKAPLPPPPRPEDRDQAKEVKHMTDEEIQKEAEMFEELPGPEE